MEQQGGGWFHRAVMWLDRHTLALFSGGFVLLFGIAFGRPTAAWYPAHDWLDSNFVLYSLRGRDPGLFNLHAELSGVLGGIPMSALTMSDLDPKNNLYILFDPFTAAALNEVGARSLGFVGLYLLIITYTLPSHPYRRLVAAGPASLFALLPYWPQMSTTIALQPLLVFAILNLLRERHRGASWAIVVLYPLVAGLVAGGFAVVGVSMVATVVAAVRRTRTMRKLAAVTGTLILGFLISEIRAFHLLFFTDFTSHRDDWGSTVAGWFAPANLARVPEEWFEVIARGQYHMASGQWGLPLLAVVLTGIALTTLLIVAQVTGRRLGDINASLPRLSVLWGTGLALICTLGLIYATERTSTTQFGHILPVRLQFNRVIILFPMLWMLMLAISIAVISHRRSTASAIVVAAATFLALGQGIWTAHSVLPRLSGYIGDVGHYRFQPYQAGPYYRQETYADLAVQMGVDPPETTVLSLGIDPMIAAFNGFKTLDGYVYNYPLEYKHAFRRIIEGELDRIPQRRQYYDGWGSRVYLFHERRSDGALYLDFCAAHDMGADFVISDYAIPDNMGVDLVGESGELLAYAIHNSCLIADSP